MSDAGASRALRVVAVPLMLLAGALVALQSQINGHLAHRMGTGPRAGFGAALVSFAIGLVVVGVVVVLRAGHRAGLLSLVRAVREHRIGPVAAADGEGVTARDHLEGLKEGRW